MSILLTVVLVEPAGPLNVGSVARLCENFGVKELRIVAPRCDIHSPEALKMAVKGKDLLIRAPKFRSLPDAIADCRVVIATCGRVEHGQIPLNSPTEISKWLTEISYTHQIALVFGREDRGLTNSELLLAQRVLTLHSKQTCPSLNLSHAVAIVLHQIEQSLQERAIDKRKDSKLEPATALELDDCLNDAEKLLLEVGFLLKHTAESRMAKVRGLLQRAAIRSKEVSLIRGMIRQLRWAIKSTDPSP